jgi:aminoglycoside phosphotransferase (APT) family kinase protein
MVMHADEFPIDAELVRRLVSDQLPEWADLPMRRVASAGTDNAMVRIGDGLVARLPRIEGAVAGIEKEQRVLPQLAGRLPFAIPRIQGIGRPDGSFPWTWTVLEWIEGESLDRGAKIDEQALAQDLATFVEALHGFEPPVVLEPGIGRGEPLANRDTATRATINELGGDLDVGQAIAIWDAALSVPSDPVPRLVHGDVMPGNLVIRDGRLHAVIDFGTVAVGDPAVDLMPAWNLFGPEGRRIFRVALDVDDGAWIKGKGWALSQAVIALPYYRETNPILAGIAKRTIAAVLADSD